VIIHQLKKNQFLPIFYIFYIYLFIPLSPITAFEARDYQIINILVNSCYEDNKSCNAALLKINSYQKDAAIDKKFSCQTRLLGLEANLIMAMSFNIKRKESKSIFQAMKKYC